MKLAIVGHVEHITLGRVPAVPSAGEIVHLGSPHSFAGGGGGLALFQMCRSAAEVHAFTALGSDEAGAFVGEAIVRAGAHAHAVRRDEPHTRVVVMINPEGERTIVVLGRPLQPRREDPLPWERLAACDAVYFTAEDPEALRAARAARVLIVTARRRAALERAGVRADVVIGSAMDARERSTLGDYAPAPAALVLTEGARGGHIETARGVQRFRAPEHVPTGGAAYGAGDSFAGALAFFLAAGRPLAEACERAGYYGAAVLAGLDPPRHQRMLGMD